MEWRHFTRWVVLSALGVATLVFAAVVLIDPYDSVWFSPQLARAPITANQRFSYPALARKPRFDSAVIGTSTVRLLRPDKLNQTLGGRFVNLSMNSATAHEQSLILDLFIRHHAHIRTLIVGVDIVWCQQNEVPRFTERPFPPWLYDDNRWNDLLYLFNLPTLEEAGRQLAFLTGFRPMRFGRDGYADFLPPQSAYDLARARSNIYPDGKPRLKEPVTPPVDIAPAERALWRFAPHDLLRRMIGALPKETRKVLLIVPYHRFFQPRSGSRRAAQLQECKRRLTDLATEFEETMVLDFMIESDITAHDENYWDSVHYTTEIADWIAELIGFGVARRQSVEGAFDYLSPTDKATQ